MKAWNLLFVRYRQGDNALPQASPIHGQDAIFDFVETSICMYKQMKGEVVVCIVNPRKFERLSM